MTEQERTDGYSEYGRFAQQLGERGHRIVGGAEMQPSTTIRTVQPGGATVTDGPFAETKELVAGFWIWKCASMAEALEWVKKCPHPHPGQDCEIEVRPFFEFEDFGDNLSRSFTIGTKNYNRRRKRI